MSFSVAWKFLTSFLRREWSLEDYPVQSRFLELESEDDGLSQRRDRCQAQIINWPIMVGWGASIQAARADLELQFQRFKESGKSLPRPGTQAPILFAGASRIKQHSALTAHFLSHVLQLDASRCFVSDETCLSQFRDSKEEVEQLYNKIRFVYGIDVSGMKGDCLVDILDYLKTHGVLIQNESISAKD